jgi:hypothetical protein
VSGINWRTVGKATFDKITEILLRREFGLRGHAVDGRGGDGGIDYDVDDAKIIFQLKYFPEGFPVKSGRQAQIRKSFKAALKHDPDEWILVVPTNVTPPERKFVTGLGKGKRVKISIRDENWLDDLLTQADNKDLREAFLFGSDIDYLHAKAEAFKNNPVIRDAADLAKRVHALQENADIVDPNWRLEFASVGGEVVQTLVPKDSGAPERAPVTITWTAAVAPDSPEQRAIEDADAYGLSSEIRLTGEMIRDYEVRGTRLLQSDRAPDELVIGPLPGLRPNWLPGELLLTGPAGERLGVFLVNVAPRSQGRKGGVVEMTLGEVLTFTLRIPHELADHDGNNIKYTFNGAAGRPVTAVFEAADFIVQLGASATCELHVNGAHHVTIESLNRTPVELIKEFRTLRLLTDDLRVIEAEAITRFRVPEHVEAVERVHIRNLRLMLEGHCVAHPTANSMTIGLSGDRDQSLDQFLNTDPKWMMFTSEPGSLEVLGQTIYLPALSYAAHFTVSQEQIDAAEAAFENNAAAGHGVVLKTRPRDRLRMFLPDRRHPNLPLEITPWDIEGIYQKGLGPDGEPLAELETHPPSTNPGPTKPRALGSTRHESVADDDNAE